MTWRGSYCFFLNLGFETEKNLIFSCFKIKIEDKFKTKRNLLIWIFEWIRNYIHIFKWNRIFFVFKFQNHIPKIVGSMKLNFHVFITSVLQSRWGLKEKILTKSLVRVKEHIFFHFLYQWYDINFWLWHSTSSLINFCFLHFSKLRKVHEI